MDKIKATFTTSLSGVIEPATMTIEYVGGAADGVRRTMTLSDLQRYALEELLESFLVDA